ncbi:MAG: hypothetical protein ACM3X0_11025 [Bacteroidota bacterium]
MNPKKQLIVDDAGENPIKSDQAEKRGGRLNALSRVHPRHPRSID